MRPLLGIIVVAVWFLIALTSAARAESVYLRDGGRVDCESFWRKGDLVVVKVNRDVVVEFGADEVDLRKTMRGKKQTAGRLQQHKGAAAKQPLPSPEAAVPVKPAETADKPAAVAPPLAAGQPGSTDAVKPSSPAAPVAAPPQPTPPEPAPPAETEKRQPTPVPAAMPQTPMSSTMMFLFVGGALAFVLLMIAAQWKVFEKAGVAGWKCLIPIYNMYVLFLISGKPGWWIILTLVPIVSVVVYLLAMLSLAGRFSKGPLYGVGLFLLPFVFFPLLAFDSSEYSG